MGYKPRARNRAILETAQAHLDSVEYRVSARWLFYRLFQDGIYSTKKDYQSRFIPLISRARHAFYANWRPYTLLDESRAVYRLDHGHPTEEKWLENLRSLDCILDPWQNQERYGLILFEAQAMFQQFAYYAPPAFSLWPLRGYPSIEYKWRIAKHLDKVIETYGERPITLFYFGDYDPHGAKIGETAIRDIWKWTTVPEDCFSAIRGGLNRGDSIRFDIPQNFEKPGEYQWEALTDKDARTLIEEALEGFYDPDKEESIREREEKATKAYQEALDGLEL